MARGGWPGSGGWRWSAVGSRASTRPAAQLTDVTFSGVALEGVVLERARCERVDLTGADLTPVTAVATLAGATISPAQAVALAARMAHGLGLRVAIRATTTRAFPALA